MFWLEEGHPASLAPGKRPRTTLSPTLGAARRRRLPRLGLARRRPAGPVDHAVLPAPRPRRDESAGGDRRAGLALRAFPDLVLAAHGAPGRAADREARAEGNPRRTGPARPHHRGRAGMVGGPPHRGVEGRQAPRAPRPTRAACRDMRRAVFVPAAAARYFGDMAKQARSQHAPASAESTSPASSYPPIIIASKLFLDGTVVAFRQLSLAVQARRDPVHRRPERLRQDHAAALHRRPDRDQHRRAAGARQAGRRPARRRRHGVPAFRPAAVEDGVRQRRVRPGDGRRAGRRHQGARRALSRTGRPRPASRSTIPISSPAACSSASASSARWR